MARRLFSDDEIARLRNLFQEADADGSGAISLDEANATLTKFGLILSPELVAEILAKVDTNQSGTIEFVEFLKFATFARGSGRATGSAAIRTSPGPGGNSGGSPGPGGVKTREFGSPGPGGRSGGSGAGGSGGSGTGAGGPGGSGAGGPGGYGAGGPGGSGAGSEVEPVVKSRSFGQGPSPSSSSEVALPVALLPNSDSTGNVNQYGILPITLKNLLPLGPTCVPYNFILNQELSGGIFKILLISQLEYSAWGRWAGVVTSANLGLRTYHIVGNNAVDHDLAQLSILGVKSNGNWRYRKPEYVEPAGRVELALEYQSAGGKLRASWNGQTLPFGVQNIPQGVRFTFELPNSLELTIVSLVKVQTPTINTLPGFTDYDW